MSVTGNGRGGLRLLDTARLPRNGVGAPRPPLRDLLGAGVLLRYVLISLATVAVIALFKGPLLAAHVHMNIWWFESLGLGGIYGRIWSTQQFLYLLFGFLTYLLLTAVFVATRALAFRPGPDAVARRADRLVTILTAVGVVLAASITGYAMSTQWQTYLLATHGQSFGILDPIHHKDLGFYVFTMPWRETLGVVVFVLLLLAAIEMGGLTLLYAVTSPYETVQGDIRRVLSVGSVLVAVVLGYLAWRNFFLNPYNLDRPGTAFGGGATFAHASLWWYPIVGTVELLAAFALLVNAFLRRAALFAAALVIPILVGIFASAGQGIFQRFTVAPNELNAEYRYLGYTLHFTRQAYGIDAWRVREYTPQTLSTSDTSANAHTVNDARIADNGAFTQVMRQRQENRTYYTFNQADIDRYIVRSHVRQVLLAARELATWKLSPAAQNWVSLHIKYTHGYGLTMAPANTVTRDGQPVLWIQNVPVQQTVSGLPAVREPRIYFGEFTNDWILTGATTPEFDSSTADQDISYRYTGPDGIPMGSGLKRLTIAWVIEGGIPFFDKLNISQYITPSTRISIRRNILDRVQTIAPWLTLDSDPYLVLRPDGSLVWMVDGLTGTDHYPYSDPALADGINYRRNSVKVVVDAYTGHPTFYAFDPHDPILRAWSSVFPGLMHSFSSMPADLKAHIKYPDDYLVWQATAYQRYHVTDITSYYNGDNEWDIENATTYNWDIQQSETGNLPPIWSVARLFGEKHDSFFSILPFSVRGKATMAGYLAANNNTYQVTALDMPRGAQTLGSTQFESLYNQAPAISQTLTLLDQRGSQVVPGQMLILPVGKALLYIKPLYLRSASAQSLPQLIRVVVGTQNEVNWGFSLRDALNNLLTQGDISNVTTTPSNPSQPTTPPAPSSGRYASLSDSQLISLANSYYQQAQQTPSLTEKDRDLKQVGAILQVLRSRHPK